MKIRTINVKDMSYRLIPCGFIVVCMLMILICGRFFLQTPNGSEPLDVLILNQETEPVFYVTSQVSYTPMQEISTTTKYKELNLVFYLPNATSDTYQQFLEPITQLCKQYDYVTLSILPPRTSAMTDEVYLEHFNTIATTLSDIPIHLIAYPISEKHLSSYHLDNAYAIGVTIENADDFNLLDALYTHFLDKKPLVVRDAIRDAYKANPNLAVKTITECYHLLAVKYPAIQTIFSPSIKPEGDYIDEAYTLLPGDDNYYLFYTIYNRLLEQPWLTTSADAKLTTISPYYALKDYDTVSGTIHLILKPDAKVLVAYNNALSDDSALYFKWNEDFLSINTSYPYATTIDTTRLHNGLSRFTVILRNSLLNNAQLYSIDINVQNPNTLQRAKRITSVTMPTKQIQTPDTTYIPVLMYHSVIDQITTESENSHVEAKLFDEQMAALVHNGYTTINFLDLKNYAKGLVTLPEKPILITMDDGYVNNYEIAFPIYKKYHIQATLFVSAFYVPEEKTDRHFGWKEAQEMEESGLIDIQSHGYNHTPFTELSQKDVLYQASLSRGIIEQHLGKRDVSVLAYPQFRHNWHSMRLLKELNFDFQITDLARVPVMASKPVFAPPELQRINVPNTITADELIETLKFYTSEQ